MLLLSLPLIAQSEILPIQTLDTNSVDGEAYIIAEANTYTPSFYKGRPEPTAGNDLYLTAVADVSETPRSYVWRIGNSGHTTNTARTTITAPNDTEVLVQLKVLGGNGRLLAETTEYISLSKPEVLFYENNLLRGRSTITAENQYVAVGEEVSLRAEPYFIGGLTNSLITWRQNSTAINNNSLDIILTKPNNDKPILLEFSLQNTNRLLETVNAQQTVNFGL